MTESVDEQVHLRVLNAAAAVLETKPFETVTLKHICREIEPSGESAPDLAGYSMQALGAEILTLEGDSMRQAMSRASRDAQDPLDRLRLAFRYVGEHLAEQSIVRAGVRIAGESYHCFPERKIDPFRTWRRFIIKALREAQDSATILPGTNIDDVAWILTASGLGTKDLLFFTGEWNRAPALLESTAVQVASSIRRGGERP